VALHRLIWVSARTILGTPLQLRLDLGYQGVELVGCGG
jgi:hypothetical protein